ncbi:MAG: 6-phosphogluconolactonase [Polyangiaceae bacterium]
MTNHNQGEVLIAADGDSLAKIAAHLVRALIAEAVFHAGTARVAISGGNTPRVMNRFLATLSLPWSSIDWFWVDDRAVPQDSPRSNAGNARDDLFSKVPIPPERIHAMPADPNNLDAGARTYERTLARYFELEMPSTPEGFRATAPQFDLLLLGIGDDGHTASLFPGETLVDVDDRWVIPVPAAEGREARLSLTRTVITRARRVIVLAQGAAKKPRIVQARAGGSRVEIPSRITGEVTGELIWLVDSAAAPLRVLERPSKRIVVGAALLLALTTGVGCHKPRFEKVPGETDFRATSVRIEAADGSTLHVKPEPLLTRLGIRAGSAIYPDRFYNPFRQIEDRRRIQAYWQNAGYFDAEASDAELTFDAAKSTVAIRWKVTEGERYEVTLPEVRYASDEVKPWIEGKIPSIHTIDLDALRVARYPMAEEIQRHGYAHAKVYTRFFVDRAAKKIVPQYLVDTGPRTRVKSIRVDGAKRVPAELVLRRTGLESDRDYDLAIKEKAEIDLRDTGAFASAFIESNADVDTYVGDVPDSGGVIDDAQVGEHGELLPRNVPESLDLVIHVREAPTVQFRARASFEADSTRLDAIGGAGVTVRNFIGPQHHLTVEGRVGHGTLWRGDTEQPTGFYGDALVRTSHPGLLGRIVDARLTGRFRDVLYPGFHLRELTAGPGLRSTLAAGLFVDLDLLFRAGQQVDFGSFDAATRSTFALTPTDSSRGAEAQASITWDRRNDPAEAMSGHLLAMRVAFAPGGPLGTHRYLELLPEARWLLPIRDDWSIGLRSTAGWVALRGDSGVPLGPRLFGGGSFGMRGFGRDRLSPTAVGCKDGVCREQVVGGLSLSESSVELRFLPFNKQYGFTTFVDAGGAGAKANPFADGLSMAVGLGPRIRLWYFPVAFDVSYRFLDQGVPSKPSASDTLLFFARIGEAF